MNRVCCIIDFEGFRVSNQFLVREVGWTNVPNGKYGCIRFDLSGYHRSREEVQHCDYVTENISGLTFEPMPGEPTIPYARLNTELLEIYNSCKSYGKNVIAYKGGRTEKDILNGLGIPCIDLEVYGCPKLDQLPWSCQPCGYHRYNGHCPLAEVHAFKKWMLERL